MWLTNWHIQLQCAGCYERFALRIEIEKWTVKSQWNFKPVPISIWTNFDRNKKQKNEQKVAKVNEVW